MILPITLTIAGAAAILHIWLSVRVSSLRRRLQIGVGDAGNEMIARRMRAHGNFAENVPIFLILLFALELAGGDRRILWGIGIAFILSRLLHAFGMDQPSPSRLRVVGMVASTLLIVGAAGWALSYAYRAPVEIHNEIEIDPGRSADLSPAPRG